MLTCDALFVLDQVVNGWKASFGNNFDDYLDFITCLNLDSFLSRQFKQTFPSAGEEI